MIDKAKQKDLAVVASSLRHSRSVQAKLAVLSCATTVLFLVLWQTGRLGPEPSASMVALLLCGATGWLAARFIALFRLRLPIETSAVYELLEHRASTILWMVPQTIYLRLGSLKIEAERIMVILTDEGKRYRVYGITNATSAQVEQSLRRIAPAAKFGWSEKNQRRYQHQTGLIVRL